MLTFCLTIPKSETESAAIEITNLSCHLDILCPICCLVLGGVTCRQRPCPRPPVKRKALVFGLFSRAPYYLCDLSL